NAVVDEATARLIDLGATVVSVDIPDLSELTDGLSLMSLEFADALATYLSRLGGRAPVQTLSQLVATRLCHPLLRAGLDADARVVDGPRSAEHRHQLARRERLREAILGAMDAHHVDALLYPHQRRLAVPVGSEQVDRNGVLSNSTGLPAVTFPAGFSTPTADAPLGVPVGLELLGRDWAEARLLAFAHAWELRRSVRRAPLCVPPLG
ncbi:MAG: amidase family protein, partial [Acidobacteriota bacterium]|nr:amidase family protein [Acidobacteriota bacterium]